MIDSTIKTRQHEGVDLCDVEGQGHVASAATLYGCKIMVFAFFPSAALHVLLETIVA